jgi:hypothetical protein
VRTITARRHSACPACRQPIEPGQTITPARGMVWQHVACAEQHARDLAADDLDALTYGYGR